MRVTEITVTAGRTFNHPYESYSNLRPEVTLRATLFDGDDDTACTRELQARAERLVEDHKAGMLESLAAINDMSIRRARIADLERLLSRSQSELDSLRAADAPMLESVEGEDTSYRHER